MHPQNRNEKVQEINLKVEKKLSEVSEACLKSGSETNVQRYLQITFCKQTVAIHESKDCGQMEDTKATQLVPMFLKMKSAWKIWSENSLKGPKPDYFIF